MVEGHNGAKGREGKGREEREKGEDDKGEVSESQSVSQSVSAEVIRIQPAFLFWLVAPLVLVRHCY